MSPSPGNFGELEDHPVAGSDPEHPGLVRIYKSSAAASFNRAAITVPIMLTRKTSMRLTTPVSSIGSERRTWRFGECRCERG
jgi:hypothetical protein